MKKLVLILLLLILPLQMSWAAASAYCQHEEGKAAQHLGHHGHRHTDKVEKPSSKQGGQSHADCCFCHAAGQASLPAVNAALPVRAASAAVAPLPFFYASHIADGPSRPDWLPVA
ncbi:MAG TPA: hypothetical protein DCW29_00620 [Janthinobacterium sp.]|nr:hypothetical protein [Janthinobacterium sp.]